MSAFADAVEEYVDDNETDDEGSFPKDGDDPLWFPDSDVDEKGTESEGSKCESVQSEHKPVSVWVLNHSVITNQEHKEKEKGRKRRNKGSYRN
jgi:hypothetical protein